MTQASVWRIAAGVQFPRRAKRKRILDETDGEVDVYDETAGSKNPVANDGAPLSREESEGDAACSTG